jgi:hypothetical protein
VDATTAMEGMLLMDEDKNRLKDIFKDIVKPKDAPI